MKATARGSWPTFVLGAAVLATGACASILGIRPTPPHSFEHRAHSIKGIHCLDCHDGVERASDTGELHLPDTATCVGCHAEPHETRDCSQCHGLSYAREGAARAREVLRFDHGQHMAKVKGDCVRCHSDAGSGAALLRPRMGQCLSCHGHDEAFAAQRCEGCHVDLRTEGTMPEDHLVHGANFARDHALAASRADGMCSTCHAERFCASCHTGSMMPVVTDRMNFDRPTGSGLHRAGFMSRHAEEARNAPGLCTTCHAPEGCADCHARSRLDAARPGSRNPHPAGWIGLPGQRNDHGAATWRDPASCEGCHGGAGEALCVSCHSVGAPGGNPHPPGHAPSGSVARAPCVRCHTGGR